MDIKSTDAKRFCEDVLEEVWVHSKGRCECKRARCAHKPNPKSLDKFRCNKPLDYRARGKDSKMGWEAHHKISTRAGGSNGKSNCEILCMECLKKVKAYP